MRKRCVSKRIIQNAENHSEQDIIVIILDQKLKQDIGVVEHGKTQKNIR